jgi:DNA invertase Pin-like site-specific DNA recombinase
MEKYKVAFYCRVANADESKIQAQEQDLLHYATDTGFRGYSVYRDNGASGLTLERPAFNSMMADIESGRVNCVIAKDISRISRSPIQFDEWLTTMTAKKIRFISVGDEFDSAAPIDEEFTANFEKAVQDYFKREQSAKIRAGIALAKRQETAE